MAETAVAAHGAGIAEELRKRPYVLVFAVLAVVTFVELNVNSFPVAETMRISALLILATIKASLVAAYYMHLRYEPRWLMFIPLGGLALVAILVVALAGTIGHAP